MSEPLLKAELDWAEAHPETTEGKNFLSVAHMYMRHQDEPTYGVLLGAANAVRRAMEVERTPGEESK